MFYRVENDMGIGPYQGSYNSDMRMAMADDHSEWGTNSHTHPSPTSRGHYMEPNEISAFRSMSQLREWFGKWLPKLEREGYHIVEIDGYVTYEDDYQVAIIPDRV